MTLVSVSRRVYTHYAERTKHELNRARFMQLAKWREKKRTNSSSFQFICVACIRDKTSHAKILCDGAAKPEVIDSCAVFRLYIALPCLAHARFCSIGYAYNKHPLARPWLLSARFRPQHDGAALWRRRTKAARTARVEKMMYSNGLTALWLRAIISIYMYRWSIINQSIYAMTKRH